MLRIIQNRANAHFLFCKKISQSLISNSKYYHSIESKDLYFARDNICLSLDSKNYFV